MGNEPTAAAPVPSDKVSVLLRWNDTGPSQTDRAVLSKQVGPFSDDAVVWVSASGESRLEEGAGTWGILVRILKDTNVVALDSDTITSPEMTSCHASASFVFYLTAKDKVNITADTIPRRAGTVYKSEASIRLDIIALAAAMHC